MRLKKLKENVGGKPLYGKKMILTGFYVREDQLAWLRNSRNGISRTLRTLIDKAMMEEGFTIPEKEAD